MFFIFLKFCKRVLKLSFSWALHSHLGIVLFSMLLSLMAIFGMGLLFGVYPWAIMTSLFEGALLGPFVLRATLHATVPLTFATLAVFLPFRAGFFNIGGQGQLEIGALAAMVVVLNYQGPTVLVILFALLAAAAAGAAAVLIPLILKIKRNASEVTTTIMMTFICISFNHAMFTGPMMAPGAFFGTTLPVPHMYRLPMISMFGFDFHVGVIFVMLLIAGVYWFMTRTVYGLRLRATGLNRNSARAAGIPVGKVFILVVLGSAALAGLAGGIQVLGTTPFKVAEGWANPWGFAGIPIAFLTGNSVLGIIPIAFLFAVLETGARHMQAMTGVPAALIHVFQWMPVLIFIAFNARRSLKTLGVV